MVKKIINISLVEFANNENMTVRAFNTLKYSELISLDKIILYYNENGDFKKLRNCGGKTNEELIKICEKYKDYIIYTPNSKPKQPEQTEQPEQTKDELKEIIENLNFRQKSILNSLIKSYTKNLSVHAYNALGNLLNNTFTIKNIYNYIFAYKNFDFINVRNVGSSSIDELNQFKASVLDYIKLVSSFEKEEDLVTEYYNSLLIKFFPSVDIYKLTNIFYDNNQIKIFSLINQLLDNLHIFNERDLIIFKNAFNYFVDFEYKQLDDIAPLINLTKERTRQLREKIFKVIDVHLKSITNFVIDFKALYNIDTDANLITVKDEIVERINKEENNKFNKLFIIKILSILKNETHSIIGDEKNIVFCEKSLWNSTYLIDKNLESIFFFNRFIKNIKDRLNNRITNTYSFHFQSYLLKFFKSIDYTRIDEVASVCEKLIFDEFGLVLDIDENIVFQRNVKKPIFEYAYEILKEAQEPLNIKEIYKRLVEKYPNYETTTNSISGAMRKNHGFIYFGRTSTFGLKIWEEKYSNIKGGTIRDIVEEFLNEYSEPKHIDEITEYVCKYRDTNAKNIYSNIRMEKNNRFLFFENSFVGLKSKQNSYSPKLFLGKSYYQRTWEESFLLLQKFVTKNHEFPTNSGTDEEKKLYRFCSVNRTRYKKGLLSDTQIKKLMSVNFPFQQSDEKKTVRKSWFENYYSYTNFIKTNNREPLSSDKNERNLYHWKRRTLKEYKDNKLLNRQIELLQKIKII